MLQSHKRSSKLNLDIDFFPHFYIMFFIYFITCCACPDQNRCQNGKHSLLSENVDFLLGFVSEPVMQRRVGLGREQFGYWQFYGLLPYAYHFKIYVLQICILARSTPSDFSRLPAHLAVSIQPTASVQRLHPISFVIMGSCLQHHIWKNAQARTCDLPSSS